MKWFINAAGHQVGPLTISEAQQYAQEHPRGYAWREGLPNWLPIASFAELGVVSPPPFTPSLTLSAPSTSDEIDYKIYGSEMQFIELALDPGESVIAEAGAMMYKDLSVEMDTVFGDGSSRGGFLDQLVGAGKRLLTGESLFMTVFTQKGPQKAKVAFSAPYPGNIIPVQLGQLGGSIICQKDSFLCAARGVSVGIFFQRKVLTGLFGGEGFVMQKLEGDGMAFLHAGGTIIERELHAGETLHVDTGCIVAFSPTVQFDLHFAGKIKTALFGGEGLFFASLRGPGKVWLQSLPFSRLAGRMLAAVPQRGSKDEGSLLGTAAIGGTIFGLGSLLGGDDE